MRPPSRLLPLIEDGVISEVLGQVRSGKEADVFVVLSGGEVRCAKVYKEATRRNFRQSADYREGRTVKNSRSNRALAKRTRFGQKEAETSWITAEVNVLRQLSQAGVRVPTPYGFFDGVLVMELVVDDEGEPAPRLDDVELDPDTALRYFGEILQHVVLMLCEGVIHGDLSEFNVLVDADGPVIIDLPQAVNASGNNNAERMFLRDVGNMTRYFGRFAPELLETRFGPEIWSLYSKATLTPDSPLTGKHEGAKKTVDVLGVLEVIGDARQEHERAQIRQGSVGPARGKGGIGRGDRGKAGKGRPNGKENRNSEPPATRRRDSGIQPRAERSAGPPSDPPPQNRWGRKPSRKGPGAI